MDEKRRTNSGFGLILSVLTFHQNTILLYSFSGKTVNDISNHATCTVVGEILHEKVRFCLLYGATISFIGHSVVILHLNK